MIRRINIGIAIGFFLVAIVGFFPIIVFDGRSLGLIDLIGGVTKIGIDDTLSYLSAFPDVITGMVRTWILCGILAIVLPLVEGVLALLLKGKWVLLSAGLGIFANAVLKAVLATDIGQINDLVERFAGEGLIAFSPGTMALWVALHVIIAGLIIWELVLGWMGENRQVRYDDAEDMIDETVVQRGSVNYDDQLMGPRVIRPEEPAVEEMSIDEDEEDIVDEKGADVKMDKPMRPRNLDPEEEKRRDELFRRLGEEYYEMAHEDPLPEFLPLIDEITELIMEPEPEPEIEAEKTIIWEPPVKEPTVEEAKAEEPEEVAKAEEPEEDDEPRGSLDDMIDPAGSGGSRCCPECGVYLPEGAKFCEECGHRIIEEPKPVAKPRPLFCPNCGNMLKEGIKFCGKCGTKIG